MCVCVCVCLYHRQARPSVRLSVCDTELGADASTRVSPARGVTQPPGAPVTFLGQGRSPLSLRTLELSGPPITCGAPVARRGSHPIATLLSPAATVCAMSLSVCLSVCQPFRDCERRTKQSQGLFTAHKLNGPVLQQVDPVTRRVHWPRASASPLYFVWLQRN